MATNNNVIPTTTAEAPKIINAMPNAEPIAIVTSSSSTPASETKKAAKRKVKQVKNENEESKETKTKSEGEGEGDIDHDKVTKKPKKKATPTPKTPTSDGGQGESDDATNPGSPSAPVSRVNKQLARLQQSTKKDMKKLDSLLAQKDKLRDTIKEKLAKEKELVKDILAKNKLEKSKKKGAEKKPKDDKKKRKFVVLEVRRKTTNELIDLSQIEKFKGKYNSNTPLSAAKKAANKVISLAFPNGVGEITIKVKEEKRRNYKCVSRADFDYGAIRFNKYNEQDEKIPSTLNNKVVNFNHNIKIWTINKEENKMKCKQEMREKKLQEKQAKLLMTKAAKAAKSVNGKKADKKVIDNVASASTTPVSVSA